MLKTAKIPSQDVQLLQALPIFASLSAKELSVVAGASKRVSFPQGAVICEEGQSGIGLHVIVDGTVDVSSTHSAPSSLGPGSYFGEIALIDRGPRLATVVAATDVTTLSIVAWDFTTLLDDHPTSRGHCCSRCAAGCARRRPATRTDPGPVSGPASRQRLPSRRACLV